MELTIDEVVHKAIEAHKSGHIQEADRLYTAILQAQPKHPDANHNMGVLAVSVGKVQESLPFFTTALEANPNIGQYWLSCIDVLIKLDRITDAKAMLAQAKGKGVNGESFGQLERRLNAPNEVSIDPPQGQLNTLINLYQKGQIQQALDSTKQLLSQFPNSSNLYNIQGAAYARLDHFDAAIDSYKKAIKIRPDLADTYNNMGVALNDKGDLDAAIDSYKDALKIKPDYADTYYNMGNTLNDKGDLDAAIDSYKHALKIKPDHAEAYSNMGNTLKDKGDLEAAIGSYKQALKIKPDSADVYHNMGIALKGEGDLDAAIDSYKTALKIKPDFAEAYKNMGNALNDKGDLEGAIDSYKQALKINPDYAEAYKNMGNTLNEKGDLEGAIDSYKQALKIKPDYTEAYNNMGNTLKDKGDLEAAIDSYKQALKIKPDNADTYYNMGNTLNDKGDLEAAIDSYKQALKIKPDYAEAYNNMGNTLKDKGDLEAAIDSYKNALKIKPDNANTYYNMGNTLNDKGDLEAAIDSYKQALKIKPDYADTYYNMGNTLNDKGDLDAAIDSYQEALKIRPDYAKAYNNMGNTLKDKGKLNSAIDSLKQAIKIKPGYADAFYNLSLSHLLQGSMEKGFNFYEWRLRKKKQSAASARANLVWDGKKSLRGKHFVIYEEQGLGDIIQFCRYLPLLEQRGANITFKVKPNLHALLETMDSNSRLLTSLPEENEIDFEAPLMSIPYLLNTNLETIPANNPYLFAGQKKIQTWAERVSMDRFKVGICWQGSKTKMDVGRSFPLSLFEGISRIPNLELISLHKGEGEAQIDGIDFDLTTLGHDFDVGQDAFLDTVAVMMNCDLIITSDTAVAHLAGAIGRPTWVVLKQVPDWRWMLDRPDSPWYPTMTLYRQKSQGDWVDVFDTIEQDLRTMLKQKKDVK